MAAVKHAFKIHGEGKTSPPEILGVHAQTAVIKAGEQRSQFSGRP